MPTKANKFYNKNEFSRLSRNDLRNEFRILWLKSFELKFFFVKFIRFTSKTTQIILKEKEFNLTQFNSYFSQKESVFNFQFQGLTDSRTKSQKNHSFTALISGNQTLFVHFSMQWFLNLNVGLYLKNMLKFCVDIFTSIKEWLMPIICKNWS